MVLAGILLIPGLATLWTAWGKFLAPTPPAPLPLTLAGLGALAINLSCALMLARFRAHSGSLTRAAFLSARNDVVANIAIVAVGLFTAYMHSAWPDLIIGLGIAAMNADAAREVWKAAREEHRAAESGRASS
jgi:Co/Zn/Cd efflux system component